MSEEVPETYPALCPYIYYEDTAAMIDWLTNAFGFRERFKEVRQDGTLGHVEMELGDAVIMMGNPPGYKNPKHLGQVSVGMYVYVDDVDAHYAARQGGGRRRGGRTGRPAVRRAVVRRARPRRSPVVVREAAVARYCGRASVRSRR